jgi:sulfhydrogenase subunit beta (sulfur reductase)
MAVRYLTYDQLPAFLGYLAEKARVVAPVNSDGVVQFRPWAPGTDVELDVLLAKQSPKGYVFPQTETYLRFRYRMEEPGEAAGNASAASGATVPREVVEVEALNEAPAQVIFGLRPCDVRGFKQMDNVFGGYGGFYFDPLYNARRQATTLLAVTCREPRSTCFCTSVGGCPAGHEGVDGLFTQVAEGFTVEALTDKGEAALSFTGFADATDAQAGEAAEVKAQATDKVDIPFTLDGIRDNLRDNIAGQGWHELSMRCISCGTCTYVCPNCYCFNVSDELVECAGERYRTWDNCFNPLYTEETSGHNPRAAKSNRFRNRFSHKFWYYPDKYDSLLCSGCGRCVVHCPTRIDIREVLRAMGTPAGTSLAEAIAVPAAGCVPTSAGSATSAGLGASAAPLATDGKEA